MRISVAINYVAVSAEGLCYLPAYGIGGAATTLVGQSIGANRKVYGQTICVFNNLIIFCSSDIYECYHVCVCPIFGFNTNE